MAQKDTALFFYRNAVGVGKFACRSCANAVVGSNQYAGVISLLKKDGFSFNTLTKGTCTVCGLHNARYLDALKSSTPNPKPVKLKPVTGDAAQLLERAINSLVLAVEIFNRMHEDGRTEAVLLLLQHSFEMLLKSIILHRSGSIISKNDKFTLNFAQCLTQCFDTHKVIDSNQKLALASLDELRDKAMHFYLEVSRDLLYVEAQSAVTLFDKLLKQEFNRCLADKYSDRVLPISVNPPRDIQLLLDSEFSQIDALMRQGRQKREHTLARLRSIMSFARALKEGQGRLTEAELAQALSERRNGTAWTVIFPEIAQLHLETEGDGINIKMSIGKKGDFAVKIAQQGEEVQGTVIKQLIDVRDRYPFRFTDLAGKLGLNRYQLTNLLKTHKVKDNPDYYHVIELGSQKHQYYSLNCLRYLQEAIKSTTKRT